MTNVLHRGYRILIGVVPTADGHYWATLEIEPPAGRGQPFTWPNREIHTFPTAEEAHAHAKMQGEAWVNERVDLPIKDANR